MVDRDQSCRSAASVRARGSTGVGRRPRAAIGLAHPRVHRQAGGQAGAPRVALEHELGAIDQAARVVARQRVVGREARLAARCCAASRRMRVSMPSTRTAKAFALAQRGALRLGHEHARVRRVADQQARDARPRAAAGRRRLNGSASTRPARGARTSQPLARQRELRERAWPRRRPRLGLRDLLGPRALA